MISVLKETLNTQESGTSLAGSVSKKVMNKLRSTSKRIRGLEPKPPKTTSKGILKAKVKTINRIMSMKTHGESTTFDQTHNYLRTRTVKKKERNKSDDPNLYLKKINKRLKSHSFVSHKSHAVLTQNIGKIDRTVAKRQRDVIMRALSFKKISIDEEDIPYQYKYSKTKNRELSEEKSLNVIQSLKSTCKEIISLQSDFLSFIIFDVMKNLFFLTIFLDIDLMKRTNFKKFLEVERGHKYLFDFYKKHKDCSVHVSIEYKISFTGKISTKRDFKNPDFVFHERYYDFSYKDHRSSHRFYVELMFNNSGKFNIHFQAQLKEPRIRYSRSMVEKFQEKTKAKMKNAFDPEIHDRLLHDLKRMKCLPKREMKLWQYRNTSFIKSNKNLRNFGIRKRIRSAKMFENTERRTERAKIKKMSWAYLRKSRAEHSVQRKEMRVLINRFKRRYKAEKLAQYTWIYTMRFYGVVGALVQRFVDRVKELQKIADLSKSFTTDEDYFKHSYILNIPASNRTGQLGRASRKMAKIFVMIPLMTLFRTSKFIKRINHTNLIVLRAQRQFRRHMEVKHRAREMLYTRIKDGLRDAKYWETELKPILMSRNVIKISDQTEILTE